MFNTYVINLKQDTGKLNIITKNLEKIGITPIIFEGIDGSKTISEDNKLMVSKGCQYFCPNSAVGIGLSHILLAKKFLATDTNDYCLILEDDAKPVYDNTIEMINETLEDFPSDWEVIKLYCQGPCNYDNSSKISPDSIAGSTCAYLISRKGAEKLAGMKVKWHIDSQFNDFIMYTSNYPLFVPDSIVSSSYSSSNVILKILLGFKLNKYDQTVDWYLGNSVFKIPFTSTNITWYRLIFFVMIMVVLFIFLIRSYRKKL
jgi:GR25 family glycosyltransferase involved in LPS biosynthesis